MTGHHTPHINAEAGDFAKTVLMPGDPLRSKFIAENFLEDARLVNNVRNVQGFTGKYKGVPVTVMASGMGMPSISIYAYELYNLFGVENIIRIGSAGGMQDYVRVHDIIIAEGACTDSAIGHNYNLPGTFAPTATFSLLRSAAEKAEKRGLSFHVGNVLSSDVFYNDTSDLSPSETPVARWGKMGVLAVEMEAAALYMTAARYKKKALAMCTVSDHLLTGESTTSEERRVAFKEMMTLSLDIAAEQ